MGSANADTEANIKTINDSKLRMIHSLKNTAPLKKQQQRHTWTMPAAISLPQLKQKISHPYKYIVFHIVKVIKADKFSAFVSKADTTTLDSATLTLLQRHPFPSNPLQESI
ncbi:MAG: hypothetical protein U1B30_14605 [Pseudomonadota bacterium]|nr:hypothetical protein [Pseudomonadota bacterium]